jgi:cyclophilin family peptidyl-prolyl cis-trans isomerase
VIQCGLHGSGVTHSFGDLSVNETFVGRRVSNTRGTAAIAHFDVPDNGNTEFFINLSPNTHLDVVYGGYCVFAEVDDEASFTVVDRIAAAVRCGTNVKILRAVVSEHKL